MEIDMTNRERKQIIAELQQQAKAVLELKNEHRQKRPVVIEFSGSPKSGKTSCINSLELFLKRNGFRVEIVQERASVCPVADKRSPMFNVWTACTSITGMLSILEKKEPVCDVLILDRGVFDAFCWFDWLTTKNMMEETQQKAIEGFLTMDSIINRIDIVFAFTATPDISIIREYANLLTDKPGTIMNKRSLDEYLVSIRRIIESKRKYFHGVFEIDTSSSDKNQDVVGKEVTEKTLDALKSMLMERIGYVSPSSDILESIAEKRFFPLGDSNLKDYLGNISFDLRETVENHDTWIQLVPIAVITDSTHKKVLAVKKRGTAISKDSPEKDKLLLYVGGHSRSEDSTDINSGDLMAICRYTLRREIKEEIGISIAFNESIPYIIYTPDSPKSKKHIAICFLVELDLEDTKLRIDAEELVQNRGTSKSGHFHEVSELLNDTRNDLESWSIEIAKHFFEYTKQLSLFEK